MLRPMKSVRETMYGLGAGPNYQPDSGSDAGIGPNQAEVISPPTIPTFVLTAPPSDSSPGPWSNWVNSWAAPVFGSDGGGATWSDTPAATQNRSAATQKPTAPPASGSSFGPFVGALAKAFTAYTPLLTSNPIEAANQQAKLQAIQAKNALNVRNVSQTKSSLIPLALGAAGLLVVGLVVVTVLKRKGK